MAHRRCNSEHMCNSPDMVCLDEEKIQCTINDTLPYSTQKKVVFACRPTYKVENLFSDVARAYSYDDFNLFLQPANEDSLILLNDKKSLALNEIPGFLCGAKNNIVLKSPGIILDSRIETNDVCMKKKMEKKSSAVDQIEMDSDLYESYKKLSMKAKTVRENNEKFETNKTELMNSNPNPPISPVAPIEFCFRNESESSSISTADNKISRKLKLKSPPCKPNSGYVGLVNQAMTCYLNSLLQALFMTPEFRNALYKMKFNEKDKSIPFQLQKLFVNLQTSIKMAVETTDLTKSFGWDSTQAWTQHDIQELCRVMFDALEKEFQRTKQENWINKYYEGKMIDYLKCLECGIEKSREDTFLDIPLPLRPFGSNRAYESVEEALRAFVQPEILDGNNQYFCEKCNKKCDAHKGLKFVDFPYILTLHLKRFDFDYQTLHRIKLNDKVTFPQTLNLNCFINATDAETFANLKNNNNNNHTQLNGLISSISSSENENSECIAKFDDCSTTDSGAALEEDNCSGFGTTASSSHHENELQDDDEGIEMSTGIENSRCQLSHNDGGPYIYELFSIMVHSGSASGGHYYAYIKDFDTGEWYCFNDQTVSPITQDDIQKSFGGDSFKPYYSGIYSSSTNAYMLMYRRIDTEQNEKAITIEEFPENIIKLRQLINDNEQEEKKRRIENEIIKRKVYFYNPKLKRMKDAKVYITSGISTLENLLEVAYGILDVQQFASIKRCRLVAYDPNTEQIEMSLDGKEKDNIEDILKSLEFSKDFLLEIRKENEEFEIYKPNGVTLKAYQIDLNTLILDGPYLLQIQENEIDTTNLKRILSKKTGIDYDLILVAISHSKISSLSIINERTRKIIFANQSNQTKENASEILKKLSQDDFPYIIYLYVTVPPTDKKSLESLCIPPYEEDKEQEYECTPKQSPSEYNGCCENDVGDSGGGDGGDGDGTDDVVDAIPSNQRSLTNDWRHTKRLETLTLADTCLENENNKQNLNQKENTTQRKSSPLPTVSSSATTTTTTLSGGGAGHESEDSSLSDGDRTLVEAVPLGFWNESSTSNSPQLSSPEDESTCEKSKKLDLLSKQMENLYFRAIEIENEKYESNRLYKIFVDKRMSIQKFKYCLQSIIGVSGRHIKVSTFSPDESCNFREGEQVNIELERKLKVGEVKAKIYYLKLSQLTDFSGKFLPICPYILQINKSLIEIKQELIAHLHKLNSDYKSLKLENCRIWRKWGRNPESIFNDDNSIADLNVCRSSCELVIQECEEHANMNTNDDTLTLFVRRWDPTKLKLGVFDEITLEKRTDIKKALASISGIDEEKIAYTFTSSFFPFTDISVLELRNYDWHTESATKANYIINKCENGNLCIYKNVEDPNASLTEKEELEIKLQERKRIDASYGTTSSLLSPRKEHALKIYLDSSPKTVED